jgi:hypothetical protein
MPLLINRLDALKARRLNSPGLYADGAGLYLQVSGNGARSWIFRFKRNGRTRYMALVRSSRSASQRRARPHRTPVS